MDNEDVNKFKDDVIIFKKIPQTARKSMKKMVILSPTSSVQNDAIILQEVNEQPDSKVTVSSQKKVKELPKKEVNTNFFFFGFFNSFILSFIINKKI